MDINDIYIQEYRRINEERRRKEEFNRRFHNVMGAVTPLALAGGALYYMGNIKGKKIKR